MPDWIARPVVRGRPTMDHLGELKGRHKTDQGRIANIIRRGKAGVTYAVAVKLDVGWLEVDPVSVPRSRGGQ